MDLYDSQSFSTILLKKPLLNFSERIFEQRCVLFNYKYNGPYSLAKRVISFMEGKNLPVLKQTFQGLVMAAPPLFPGSQWPFPDSVQG